jgi:hypothetical protein
VFDGSLDARQTRHLVMAAVYGSDRPALPTILLAYTLGFKARYPVKIVALPGFIVHAKSDLSRRHPVNRGHTPCIADIATMHMADGLDDLRASIRRRGDHLGQEPKNENLDTHGN